MGVYEVTMRTETTEITGDIYMHTVNECVVHHVKPKFFRGKAKRSEMLSVRCLSADCARCCDATYDKDAVQNIVNIWNKWNPKNRICK